ncbi:MAG: MBL fold metallo-hydrolase [Flexilinea sp.]|nr:MBL fold metallo-hydrolase [Flexilinea sp.]
MDITFINVGYGESILITCADPENEDGQFVMLIDGGSSMDSEFAGESGRIRAIDFLRKKNIRHIDLLVFSHIHEDHTCGLVPVIRSIPVKQYWTSVMPDPAHFGKQIVAAGLTESNRKALASINAFSMLMAKLQDQDITRLDGVHPEYFRHGDLSIDILGPDERYRDMVETFLNFCFTAETAEALNEAITDTAESMNSASLILRLRCKGRSVLLCGDTAAGGFSHIYDTDPALLKADIFKIGHHGQPDSVTEALVRAVDPSFIVCCASNDHRSNSSNERTFETIRQATDGRPVTYLFQDGLYNAQWNENTAPRNGVTLRIDDSGISWQLE